MLLMVAASCWSSLAGGAMAQEAEEAKIATRETPLYEEDPYDLITLKGQEDKEPLKVEPLDLPNRRIPKYLRPTYRLKVVLWDEPEKKYELRWAAVERIDLFEQLVLAKAKELVEKGDREAAYDYLQWLEAKDPTLPGLAEVVEDYLYREAGIQIKKGDLFGALIILFNLCDHNPEYPRLSNALGVTAEKLLQQYDASGNYAAARAMLRNLRARFPDHPTVVRWESDLQGRAARHLAAARKSAGRGAFREADRATQQAVRLWPELAGVEEMRSLLHRRYPRVLVGVIEPAVTVDPRHRQDWAVRRSSRLTYRTLTELLGPGAEGGEYVCPVGQIEIEPLQRRLVIQIRPNIRWSQGDRTLSGVDVARRLLAMAQPQDDQYRAAWSELFAGATVRDVYQIEVAMRRPHVRPDALLGVTLAPYGLAGASSLAAPTNGPFTIDETNKDETVYVASPRYFMALRGGLKEVVEQPIRDDRQAIRALREGQIQVIDRLYPWTLHEFRSMKNVVVEPYVAPLVHCLLPNRKRKLMDDKVFRRALVYGIHRRAILQHLLGSNTIEGCCVTSGPFLQGTSYDDPLGYAYDTSIEPRPYEPGLAVMLAAYVTESTAKAKVKQAVSDKSAAASQPAEPKKPDSAKPAKKILAKLTLAHPPHEIARTACQKIKDQLAVVGIEISLRELPPGPCDRIPDDVDLLYAELPMWEPVVDSRELLSTEGPTGGASPYMSLVLRQLRDASDWQQVRPLLRQIHRIAHDDVAIIPLWQLVDHFAYHKSLKGVGVKPVSLYQNVEQWQLTTPALSEGGASTSPGEIE